MVTQIECLCEHFNRFRVVLPLVIYGAQFVVYERIRRANDAGLLDEFERLGEVVGAQMLHANVQGGQMASREQIRRCAIRRHCLIALVLSGERIPKPDPRRREGRFQRRGFAGRSAIHEKVNKQQTGPASYGGHKTH